MVWNLALLSNYMKFYLVFHLLGRDRIIMESYYGISWEFSIESYGNLIWNDMKIT